MDILDIVVVSIWFIIVFVIATFRLIREFKGV